MINLEELYPIVEDKMNEQRTFTSDDVEKQAEIMKLYNTEQEFKRLATEGSEEAREFTKNKIYFILCEMNQDINMNTVDGIIGQYHVNYYNNIFTDNDSSNIAKEIDKEIEEYFSRFSISQYDSFENKLAKLAQIIYQELYGFSILDELIFESTLNEVAANRYDYIWIQYKGINRQIPNYSFRFKNNYFYETVIRDRFTSTAHEEMNQGNPYVNCDLRNGYRVAASCPPLTKNRRHAVSVRLFTYDKIEEENRDNFLKDKLSTILRLATSKGRRNVAVIGDTGTGKTTFVDKEIISSLDDDIAIGIAENIHELNIADKYVKKNVLEFSYNKIFKPHEIIEMFLRFKRDIIILGEVRNHMEAFEIIKAMVRQSRGSMFTFHSETVERMIHNLRQLLMHTGYYTSYQEAQFDVADAVDLVFHIKLDRNTGKRYIFKVSELIADYKDMTFEINDLFVYDKEDGKYFVNRNGLNKKTLSSCLEYDMYRTDVEKLKNLFIINENELSAYKYMESEVSSPYEANT